MESWIVVIGVAIVLGAIGLWVLAGHLDKQAAERARAEEAKRFNDAASIVLREDPRLAQVPADFEIYAHKLMRQLNWDNIVFTYKR